MKPDELKIFAIIIFIDFVSCVVFSFCPFSMERGEGGSHHYNSPVRQLREWMTRPLLPTELAHHWTVHLTLFAKRTNKQQKTKQKQKNKTEG